MSHGKTNGGIIVDQEHRIHWGEHDERQAKARRIAIEWPYTAAQVLQVVNAADGDEIIARKALTSTAQIGYGDHLTNAARAAWRMRKASAGS